MDDQNRDRTPADLVKIAERLREERPVATPLELDRIKLRVRDRAERSGTSFYATQKGKLMKSRLALMLMIALGLMMSTTGATLAITGSSGSGSAAENQYDTVQPQQNVNPQSDTSPEEDSGDDEPQSETLGDTESGDTAPEVEQVSVADDDDSLPFTGFVAIPLLIGGVALVSAGAVLRRKAD
jgi:hypothetical protein